MADVRSEVLAHASRVGGTCTVRALRERLTAKRRADLDLVLADDSLPAKAIERWLVTKGLTADGEVKHLAIQRHRRKDCRCS